MKTDLIFTFKQNYFPKLSDQAPLKHYHFNNTESMIQIQAKYTCEVGQENNENRSQWVLPYKDPCKCSEVRYGGANMFSPTYSFKPVYVETPMIGNNIGKIRDHFGLNCIGKIFFFWGGGSMCTD